MRGGAGLKATTENVLLTGDAARGRTSRGKGGEELLADESVCETRDETDSGLHQREYVKGCEKLARADHTTKGE